jgi:hypothetical protein
MSAAYVSPVDRQTEWRGELERILGHWAELPAAARSAVRSVVASVLREPDLSPAEAALVRDLLARRFPAHQRSNGASPPVDQVGS